MLNKLLHFVRKYEMVQSGDKVICAVSGGADSVALLWAMYLLRDKLNICVEAAHFNHNLRGEESQRDEAFVTELCSRYDIPLHIGRGEVVAGKKGLEAAARNARYEFLQALNGKIATAHTADDNAETVLMHLLRGAGLNGLGGITPVRGNLIRPMLSVTRKDVIAFLQEYHLSYVVDSSNQSDIFLRNRIRHGVMPVLQKENPSFASSVSQMALRLREDEAELSGLAQSALTNEVEKIRQMPPAIRNRVLATLLESFGVKEPDGEHIALLERIVFSENPSAEGNFPGNIRVGRVYGRIEKIEISTQWCYDLPLSGIMDLPEAGLRVIVGNDPNSLSDCSFVPRGKLVIRSRLAGDTIRLQGGTKTLKKLFIDRKIPAAKRNQIPVVADDDGVIFVYGLGVNTLRVSDDTEAISLRFENRE